MEKHFVTYNQSLALKELGFNEECLAYYSTQDVFKGQFKLATSNCQLELMAQAPLKSQVFEWARKNYNKLSAIDHSLFNGWYFVIREIGGTTDPMLKAVSVIKFKTYEEAESACIDKLIEIIKKK